MDRIGRLVPTSSVMVDTNFAASYQNDTSLIHWPLDVVPLASDISVAPHEEDSLRNDITTTYGLSDRDLVIGMITMFDPNKGVHVTLKATAPLLRERPNVKLLLVGDPSSHLHPDYSERLSGIIQDQGVGDSVIFAAFRRTFFPFLQESMS